MSNRPLILLVFANTYSGDLSNIAAERQLLIELLRTEIDNSALDIEVDIIDYTTIDGVLKALSLQRERLAILHFAGHSGTDLLQLDDGKIHARGFATKLGECSNLKLVFLNGCNNSELVKAIYDAGVPTVIGTRQTVDDEVALYFSKGFFDALATYSKTLSEAFANAKTEVNARVKVKMQLRSLDIENPENAPKWAWFMESRSPNWRLSDAAHPCNRLPTLPRGELPSKPFKNLYNYTEDDAEIFFGRCQELLRIIHIIDTAKEPIIILCGGTGVGKSSFLQAGLIPRLELSSRKQMVKYWRLSNQIANDEFIDFFCINQDKEKPDEINNTEFTESVLVIDQFEEIFHNNDAQKILSRFLQRVHYIYNKLTSFEGIKIIISLRKEWGYELEQALSEKNINYNSLILNPLDGNNIKEIIESYSNIGYVHDRYNLVIENGLTDIIANDLTGDEHSNIAPSLQIILSKLWENQKKRQHKEFKISDYIKEKRNGISISKYIDSQLRNISEELPWGADAGANGLLLDILYLHITLQGYSRNVHRDEILKSYSHINNIEDIVHELKDRHLLIDPQGLNDDSQTADGNRLYSRIAHDAIAQQVKLKYEISELIGQRASRIIKNKKISWVKKNKQYIGPVIDKHDLKTIKKGTFGTRNWKNFELENAILNKSNKYNYSSRIKNFIPILLIIITALYLIITLPSSEEHNKIINLRNELERLSHNLIDRPEKIKPKELYALIKKSHALNEKLLTEENLIIKNIILARSYSTTANFFKIKNELLNSNSNASKSIYHSEESIKLIELYGRKKDFIIGEKPDGEDDFYYFSIHLSLENYALLDCNGIVILRQKVIKQKAINLAKKITRKYFYNQLSENDLCLNDFSLFFDKYLISERI